MVKWVICAFEGYNTLYVWIYFGMNTLYECVYICLCRNEIRVLSKDRTHCLRLTKKIHRTLSFAKFLNIRRGSREHEARRRLNVFFSDYRTRSVYTYRTHFFAHIFNRRHSSREYRAQRRWNIFLAAYRTRSVYTGHISLRSSSTGAAAGASIGRRNGKKALL